MVRIQHLHCCGPGSIPGLGSEIPRQATVHCSQNKKKKIQKPKRRTSCISFSSLSTCEAADAGPTEGGFARTAVLPREQDARGEERRENLGKDDDD